MQICAAFVFVCFAINSITEGLVVVLEFGFVFASFLVGSSVSCATVVSDVRGIKGFGETGP